MGGNEADAQEAFSRSLIKIWLKLPEQRQRITDLRAWLMRITYNACMDLHRENRRRLEESLEQEKIDFDRIVSSGDRISLSSADDPERSLLEKELQHYLRQSIDALPGRLRETLLCHLSAANYREVAESLAISEVNARKRLQEAREILGRRLAEYRSGNVELFPRMPVATKERRPDRSPAWRVHAVRPIQVRLASGVEVETVLWLGHSPRRPSKQRLSTLESYLGEHPGSRKKRLELGRELLEMGRLEEACAHLEQVVQKQPWSFEAWADLVTVHRLLDRPAEAVCRRALGVLRGVESRWMSGLLAQCQGRPDAAEATYEEACRAAPGISRPWVALAEVRLELGRPSEAVRALDAALEADPDDAAALTLGVEALWLAGRAADAQQRTLRALEIDGDNLPALVGWFLARCRATGGRFARNSPERRRLLKVRELARTRADARSAIAFWLACRGDLAAAEEQIAELSRERPGLLQVWQEQARLLDWLGKSAEALTCIDRVLSLAAPSRTLDLLACRLAVRERLRGRALRHAGELLERHGGTWEALATVAWSLTRLGEQPGKARELSTAAVALQPDLPAAWLEHGRVLSGWGLGAEAITALETAWGLLPESRDSALGLPVACELVALCRALGQRSSARIWSQRARGVAEACRTTDPLAERIWLSLSPAEAGDAGAWTDLLRIEKKRVFTAQIAEASFGC